VTRRRVAVLLLAAANVVLLISSIGLAEGSIRAERVRFEKGASSAVVQGKITGYETVDYVVGARQGQHANVSLATRHTATYFNLLAPGQTEVAFFNGSVSENHFEGTLPASGDYRIRVYMMRSAARRNELADYRLEIAIGSEVASTAPSNDATVPGTAYNATGSVPCAMGGGRPTGACPFGVVRKPNGSAVVTVTKPDGRPRSIFFEKSSATGCDSSPAEAAAFSAVSESDLTIVHIGEERYEIPDAVIDGG